MRNNICVFVVPAKALTLLMPTPPADLGRRSLFKDDV